MRNSVEPGDFATYVERELSSSLPSEVVAAPTALPPRSSDVTERIVVALLYVLMTATFAGVGILAIASGVSSGRSRLTGNEFVLTGTSATIAGIFGIVLSAVSCFMFLRQLPPRTRKGTLLFLIAIVLAAIAFAFI